MMRVELKVDEKDIVLNAFTQEIIGKAISAMAEALHGVSPEWKAIEIRITK